MAEQSFVTECPDELFDAAERDIINIDVLNKDTVYPPDRKYDIICFHATQAVEKFLKGFIIKSGKKIEKTHNLSFLLDKVISIDPVFSQITDECLLLNKYTPSIKYNSDRTITKDNIVNVITSVNTISNFPQIKSLRFATSKKNNYQIVTEAISNSE